jgi:hypothetical protein
MSDLESVPVVKSKHLKEVSSKLFSPTKAAGGRNCAVITAVGVSDDRRGLLPIAACCSRFAGLRGCFGSASDLPLSTLGTGSHSARRGRR